MLAREPIQIVEIDVDGCSLTFGVGTCTAVLALMTQRKCFNTHATCRAPAAFAHDKAFRTLRFCTSSSAMPKGATYFPAIASVSEHSATVNIAGVDEELSPLGRRATVNVGLIDFPYHDALTDPYRDQRISGAAQIDESGYDPAHRGTFFSKLKARWPYYAGRPLRVINAYIENGALVEPITRHYIITGMAGPDSDGQVTFEAADVLDLAKNDKAVAPKASNGVLLADIANNATSLTLTPTGIGNAEYPASGRVLIGSEIMTFTRAGDTLSLTGRGVARTTAAAHQAGATVQLVLHVENVRIDDMIRSLLVDYAGIDAGFIDFPAWQAEIGRWLPELRLTTHIVKPTGVSTLIGELLILGVSVWWDSAVQKIGLKANRPPAGDVVWQIGDAGNIKRISQEDQDDKRLTQVHFYSVTANPTASTTSPENFDRMMPTVDLSAQEAWRYGQTRIRQVFCRWLDGGSDDLIRVLSQRLLSRFVTAPAKFDLLLDVKDAAIGLTDVLSVTSDIMDDETGKREVRLLQVIERSEPVPGHEIRVRAQVFLFSTRFSVIGPNDLPTYDAASDADRTMYAFIGADTPPAFPDGSDYYRFV